MTAADCGPISPERRRCKLQARGRVPRWHVVCDEGRWENASPMSKATLTISSKNYSSWSLRGWLLCKFAGIDFVEETVPFDDPSNRAEILLLSPSILVPCLMENGVKVWDTLSIAE